jgi:hypothetical protein
MTHHSTVRLQRHQVKYKGDFSIRTPCKRECCNKSRGEYLGNCDDGGGVYSPSIKTLLSKTFGTRRISPVVLGSSLLESEAGLDFRNDECMWATIHRPKGNI